MQGIPGWFILAIVLGPYVIGGVVMLAGLFLRRRFPKFALVLIGLPLLVFLVPPLLGWMNYLQDDRYIRSMIIRAPEASLPKGSALVVQHDGRLCSGICEGLSYRQFSQTYTLREPGSWNDVLSEPIDFSAPIFASGWVNADDPYRREYRKDAVLPDDLAYVLITGELENLAPHFAKGTVPDPQRFDEGKGILIYKVEGKTLDIRTQTPVVRLYRTASEYLQSFVLPLHTDRRYLPTTDGIDLLFKAAKP